MSTVWKAAAPIVALVFAACAHSGTVPSPVDQTGAQAAKAKTGTFTEFALPAGTNPTDLTEGPSRTIWFVAVPTSAILPLPMVDELFIKTGSVKVFTDENFVTTQPPGPSQFVASGIGSIANAGGRMWFFDANPLNEDEVHLANVTPDGVFTEVADVNEQGVYTNITVGPDGRIWFWTCPDCGSDSNFVFSWSTSGAAGPFGSNLIPNFSPTFITPGPDGNLYATGVNFAATPQTDSQVAVVTTSAVLLHTFLVAGGSGPLGIATGCDGNLWITETRTNQIARMSTTGAITQFSIPTPNAGPDRITAGLDNALWFTETDANQIGRITTSGQITEFAIPTAASGATGIIPCVDSCRPHGGVWFTETQANKIGRFISPIRKAKC